MLRRRHKNVKNQQIDRYLNRQKDEHSTLDTSKLNGLLYVLHDNTMGIIFGKFYFTKTMHTSVFILLTLTLHLVIATNFSV